MLALTEREIQTMDLITQGYTMTEVAEKRGVTKSTVTTTVMNIKTKLGAQTLGHVVAIYVREIEPKF